MVLVIKKSGIVEDFSDQKLLDAVHKSAERAEVVMTNSDDAYFLELVKGRIAELKLDRVPIKRLHNFVELALDRVNPDVAASYRNYRNYREELADTYQDCMDYSLNLITGSDRENANADSDLTAVKQALTRSYVDKKFYMMSFLSQAEKEADKIGFIYIHDKSGRRYSINCCLFDAKTVLEGGFTMGNIAYTEPRTLETAFDVIGDIVLSTASQQYGGFTIPEIDSVLEKYAAASFKKYVADMLETLEVGSLDELSEEKREFVVKKAYRKLQREMEQGFQGWECKFNTVGSSRGDYPFTTLSFGLNTSVFGKMLCHALLKVRKKGQGKPGKEIPVLFPKLVFLYDEKLHGPGGCMEDVFHAAVQCSQKTMYPDWLSLTGEGYVADMYKQYGLVVSPMGCRAFLSPWYERGGMEPADEYDRPVFIGRFNIGVVSLNLPMILQESRIRGSSFWEFLDVNLELIRGIHKKTYAYLATIKASSNPMAFCEGGFLGGHLRPTDTIAPLLESATASFGITALNELQMLYNGKGLHEDNAFALETLTYINKKIKQFSQEDHHLYAIYGTPAENLAGLQASQFRTRYGIVPGVSDKKYVSNSFHCHVAADITPLQKQDLERPFWELCNGGKIQYVKYPIDYNYEAVCVLIRRAMKYGYYEGVNLSLSFCNDCGYQTVTIGNTCPCCGSENVTQIDRMNGYLAYSKLSVMNSDGFYSHYSRLSDAKMAEIADRKSM